MFETTVAIQITANSLCLKGAHAEPAGRGGAGEEAGGSCELGALIEVGFPPTNAVFMYANAQSKRSVTLTIPQERSLPCAREPR